MGRFVVRRLAGMAIVLFAVSVVAFLVFNVIPGSNPAQRLAGRNATPQLVASIEEEWGFDESLPQQYLSMMKNIFSGDVVSYANREDVVERIVEGIPATLSLCVGAAVLWLVFGILFGYLSAVRAGSWLDKALTAAAVTGISIPAFWLAAVLLNYLSYQTGIFPSSGYVGLAEEPFEWAYHLALPWVTLAVLQIGFYSRVLRSNMLDAMGEDHVRAARAKGLSERRVMTRHVLRNSLIPIVTLLGLDVGVLLGGAILIEAVFSLNGVGQYLFESLKGLDVPPVMTIVLFGAFFVVFCNAVADIACALLDPRVKLGGSSR